MTFLGHMFQIMTLFRLYVFNRLISQRVAVKRLRALIELPNLYRFNSRIHTRDINVTCNELVFFNAETSVPETDPL